MHLLIRPYEIPQSTYLRSKGAYSYLIFSRIKGGGASLKLQGIKHNIILPRTKGNKNIFQSSLVSK